MSKCLATTRIGDRENNRLVLRKALEADLEEIVALKSDPRVRRFLGGAVPEEKVPTELLTDGIESVTAESGAYVVASARTDKVMGTVALDRRPLRRPGHVRPDGNELELSYLLIPEYWGQGFALAACESLIDSAEAIWSGEPVLVVTQEANAPAVVLATRLGFELVETFEEFGTSQWLGARTLRSTEAADNGVINSESYRPGAE